MEYTHNWNQAFVTNVKKLNLMSLNLCLEIGVFEGKTTNYIIDNMLTDIGKLICVDPLQNSYLIENLTPNDELNNIKYRNCFKQQYDRFIKNTEPNFKKIELYRELSSTALPKLALKYKNQLDFIYVDGDHREQGVYLDGLMALELTKPGGIILFDDYLWEDCSGIQTAKKGIDRFLNNHQNNIQILISNYQLAIKKL